MVHRTGDFPVMTKRAALLRQHNRCALCGVHIHTLGEAGRPIHRFGEGARAHHVKHVKFGGDSSLDNCVIICESCHYSVHEGGNFRHGTVIGKVTDFPYFLV
jgi:5-methylcytosine-specific restriction endonuclease McrA